MPTRKQRTPTQLTLDSARKPTGRGGWRPNAGRPKGRTVIPHETRAPFSSRIPQHVTLRLVEGLPSMGSDQRVGLIRTQLALSQRKSFRIIEFSIQDNHLHFIIEADDEESLASGVAGLEVRIARRINRQLGRTGDFFEERYHNRSLGTPREVRHALRYVLNNSRHHDDERGIQLDPRWLDPYSSAPWFQGWAAPVETSTLPASLLALPPPTVSPTVWLLTTGWKKHGLIRFDEVPGRIKRTKTR